MKTIPERLSDLRAAMAKHGCDAYIMPTSDPHTSEYVPDHYTVWAYFSGFYCENSNLVVTADDAAMWVDGRFFGAADSALEGTGISSMHMGVAGVPTVNEWIGNKLKDGSVLGYCAETMPISQSRELAKVCEKHNAKLVDLSLADEAWTEGRPGLPTSEAWILDAEYAGKSAAEKIELVRGKLREEKCTAMLVTRLDSVAWLLNLRASDVEDTPYALAFCYLDQNNAVLFIDSSRVPENVKNEIISSGVSIQNYEDMPKFLENGKEAQTVLIEPTSLNSALYNALSGNNVYTIVETEDPIRLIKSAKDEVELKNTRHAHLKDGAAMVRFQIELEKRLAAGETLRETDIDTILHKYRGSSDKFITESFPTIAAYGTNAAMMHYAPKKGSDAEILRKGYLLVDSGATYLDGTTDITRTYRVGEVTEQEKLDYTRVLRGHIDVAMAVWMEGANGGQLDMLVRQPLWKHKINYRCGTGHGVAHVGAVHEGPQQIRPHNKYVFVPGMVITDEPGIYEEGRIGVRIENELVCCEAGTNEYGNWLCFEPITFVPIDTSCVIPEELTKEEKEWLNDYHAQVVEKLTPFLNEEEIEWLKVNCAAI